jgi:translation initiation factor 4G
MMIFVKAAREKLAQEEDAFMRHIMSRLSTARRQPKAGDLSEFGKINQVASMSFAPTSVFNNKKGDPKSRDSPVSRTVSSSNMFSMLQSSDAIVDPPTLKGSRPPSRKPRVDLGVSGPPKLVPQRRKLQLLPRTRHVGEQSKASTPAVSEAGSDDEAAEEGDTLAPAAMSEGEAKSKIDEDVKEFFAVRLLDGAESYFSSLPTEHRHRLVETLVMKSIEMKEPDVRLVGDLFVHVREKDLCSPATFEEGFLGLADLLDDLPVIIPKAWLYFAILLKGSGLDQYEERYARIAEKTLDPDRLNRLL